jgi:hypothetical protein
MIEAVAVPRRITLLVALAACVAAGLPVSSAAGDKSYVPPPDLSAQHASESGVFSFRTPPGWTVENTKKEPETVNASGDGVRVRFVYLAGEYGYDSLHGACMLERLAAPADTSPVIKYEYDFMGGDVGNGMRALDSAFTIKYDNAVHGHKEWRQRNVTVVGSGHSMCAVSYAPASVWKKSKETRALLDAVLASVTFK